MISPNGERIAVPSDVRFCVRGRGSIKSYPRHCQSGVGGVMDAELVSLKTASRVVIDGCMLKTCLWSTTVICLMALWVTLVAFSKA